MGKLLRSNEKKTHNGRYTYGAYGTYVYACSVCGSEVYYRNNHGEEYSKSICRKCQRAKDILRNVRSETNKRNSIREDVLNTLCEDYNLDIMLTKTSKSELKAFIHSLIPMEEIE